MAVKRSRTLIRAGLFLARYGADGGRYPPRELETQSWDVAYALFYGALNEGRSLTVFHNTLKNTRDQFDSHVQNARKGWFVEGSPKPLAPLDLDVFAAWQGQSRDALWEAVAPYADVGMPADADVLRDLKALDKAERQDAEIRMEGGRRVVISHRVERDPRLRTEALRLHGYSCQACGFNFGRVYGQWGAGYAEVHHARLLASRATPMPTDPATDLVVLCANCHRMTHRRRDQVLTIEELRSIIDISELAAWARGLMEG